MRTSLLETNTIFLAYKQGRRCNHSIQQLTQQPLHSRGVFVELFLVADPFSALLVVQYLHFSKKICNKSQALMIELSMCEVGERIIQTNS